MKFNTRLGKWNISSDILKQAGRLIREWHFSFPRLKDSNKHIPLLNIIYLIELLKFNFWVACQPSTTRYRHFGGKCAPCFCHFLHPKLIMLDDAFFFSYLVQVLEPKPFFGQSQNLPKMTKSSQFQHFPIQ